MPKHPAIVIVVRPAIRAALRGHAIRKHAPIR
jgi:hypothetical protein